MNISQMKQLICVLSCGSINKAAEQLNISQSGLSASIKALETELGQPVLRRSHNGITLTTFGIEFLNTAQQITELYDNFLLKSMSPEQDRLYISSQFLLYAGTAFTQICSTNENLYTTFRFAEKGTNEVVLDIINGTSDIGIIVTPTFCRDRLIWNLKENGLDSYLVCSSASRCMVGPHSPLYQLPSDSIHLNQLSLFPRLEYEDRGLLNDKALFESERTHFPCSSRITISDTGSFHHLLEQTNCFFIGIYNEHAYSQTRFYSNIRVLNICDSDFPYDTLWLRRRGWQLTPLAKRYLQLLYQLSGAAPIEGLIV